MNPTPHSLAGQTVLLANPSSDLYGSDRMVLEAARGLVEHGCRVVATTTKEGPLVDRLVSLGVQVQILDVPIVRKQMLSVRGLVDFGRTAVTAVHRMRRLIKSIRPDAVLANTLTIPIWTVAARLCRTPAIVYVHEAESSLPRPARVLLTAPLCIAEGVIYNSETSRTVSCTAHLERRDRVRVVLNGVTGPAQLTPPRESLDPPVRLVYVGRLSPRKGVDVVIHAVSELRKMGVDATASLVGDVFPGYEWYEAELRAAVQELELGEAVRFSGFQSLVWDAIADSDIMVVPSRGDESFGNVVIEAVMSARPVVVSDHSGLREAARGFDSVVRSAPGDPDALAASVEMIVNNWGTFRAASEVDASSAAERLGTQRFHREFGQALADLLSRHHSD